jgi:hypothetical protein
METPLSILHQERSEVPAAQPEDLADEGGGLELVKHAHDRVIELTVMSRSLWPSPDQRRSSTTDRSVRVFSVLGEVREVLLLLGPDTCASSPSTATTSNPVPISIVVWDSP